MCIRDRGEALQAVAAALKTPGIRVAGIHCHIGSQIFDIDPFCHAAEMCIRDSNVPFAIADATTLTEAGYVGEDVMMSWPSTGPRYSSPNSPNTPVSITPFFTASFMFCRPVSTAWPTLLRFSAVLRSFFNAL